MPSRLERKKADRPAALLIHLPANNGLGKTIVGAPVTHIGDPDGAPGSLFWLGPALAIVAIWKLNKWMQELSPLSVNLK